MFYDINTTIETRILELNTRKLPDCNLIYMDNNNVTINNEQYKKLINLSGNANVKSNNK